MYSAYAGHRPVVMHLIDTAGPGGAETVFSQIASRIGDGHLRALAVVPREDWLSRQLRTLGIEPVILNARGSLNVRYLRSLVRIVRAHHVELIHTHLLGSAVYGSLVGMLTHVPVVSVFHGPTDLRSIGRLPGLKRWLIRRGCSAVVAVSSSTYDALLDFGMQASHISLIQNGVDTETYVPGDSAALREELGLSAEDTIVGAVGNIRTPKAYDVLLRAAAQLDAHPSRPHFVVVGEGNSQQMAPLLELRRSLGLDDRVHFLGFRRSTAALFHGMDLFVSSSRTEGLSLSFLEAMATARAIVATRSGGPQEAMTDGESGLLVPTEDPGALATALAKVIQDPDLKQRLGHAARMRVVEKFSIHSTIAKYQQIYDHLLTT